VTVVRFQADADLKQAIVTGAVRRQVSLDFQSANAAGLEGKKDSEVLAIATQAKRILVTHNRKTMPTEFGEFVMS
jgi:predicted nuclease of predicted toxin-antitoxin system